MADAPDGETALGGLIRRHAWLIRRAITASTVALCLLVLAVAVVATIAESFATWQWYFRMEQTIALATPVTIALLVISFVGGFALVAVAPAD